MEATGQRVPETMVGRIPAILRYVIHVDSLLAMAGLAIVLSVLEWVGTLPGNITVTGHVAARLLWCTYFFLVARKASLGKLRLPVPSDFRDVVDALFRPLLAVGFATSWFWIVAGVTAAFAMDPTDLLQRFQAHALIFLRQQGMMGYLLLALGLVYLPLALVGALCGARSLWRHLDPLRGFRLVRRVPRAYALMFTVLSVLALVGFLLEAVSVRLVDALPIPLAAPVIRHLMRLWVPLAQARLVGGFVLHNRPLMRPGGDAD